MNNDNNKQPVCDVEGVARGNSGGTGGEPANATTDSHTVDTDRWGDGSQTGGMPGVVEGWVLRHAKTGNEDVFVRGTKWIAEHAFTVIFSREGQHQRNAMLEPLGEQDSMVPKLMVDPARYQLRPMSAPVVTCQQEHIREADEEECALTPSECDLCVRVCREKNRALDGGNGEK